METAGDRVWLIAPDWQVRALLRAQLLADGYDVTAMADWEALQALLLAEEVMPPGLLIAALTGAEPPAALTLLRAFPARRLILRSAAALPAAALRAAGIDAVLSRPFSIGDVVRAARNLVLTFPPVSPTLELTVNIAVSAKIGEERAIDDASGGHEGERQF